MVWSVTTARDFSFSEASKPALETSKVPVYWVQQLFPRVYGGRSFKLTTPLSLVLRLRISAAILLAPTSILSWHAQATLPAPFIRNVPTLQQSVKQQMKKFYFTITTPQMEMSSLLHTLITAALIPIKWKKIIGSWVALDVAAVKPSHLHQRQSFSCTIVELVINMTYNASCCFLESYSWIQNFPWVSCNQFTSFLGHHMFLFHSHFVAQCMWQMFPQLTWMKFFDK